MNFTKLKNCMHNQIVINKRLKAVCLWYLLFLMTSVRKHSLIAAAQFSGLATSQFSRFLKNHTDVAVYNLNQLSKKQAKQFSVHKWGADSTAESLKFTVLKINEEQVKPHDIAYPSSCLCYAGGCPFN